MKFCFVPRELFKGASNLIQRCVEKASRGLRVMGSLRAHSSGGSQKDGLVKGLAARFVGFKEATNLPLGVYQNKTLTVDDFHQTRVVTFSRLAQGTLESADYSF